MIIYLKNKHTLVVDEFQFRCAIGKNGLSNKKIEGDFCTPKGIFKLEKLYYRKDRVNFEKCGLKSEKINNRMVGSFRVISAFRFFVAHNITAGEGGMVFTNNKNFFKIYI